MDTGAREDVLTFYKKLPFNSNEKPEVAANLIRKVNNVEYIYPSVSDFYFAKDFLEIGCGAGWLSNSVAYYYGLNVTGIDFNSDVIQSARKTAEILEVNSNFECVDLFKFECEPKDVVISVGVLHHTSDCGGGGKKVYRIDEEQRPRIYRAIP